MGGPAPLEPAAPREARAAPSESGPPACPVCGGTRLSKRFAVRGGASAIHACEACGTGIAWPRPEQGRLRGLYARDYHRRGKGRLSRPTEWFDLPFKRSLARKILRRFPTGRFLDVGYGRGTLLIELAARGIEASGVEIAPEVPGELRGKPGIRLLAGDLRDLALPEGHFDAVGMIHVLEHLADPAADLREARRILKPGGLLFLSVPNWASLQARAAGAAWFHLDPPYHLHHFTLSGLSVLAERTGFRIESASPGGLDHHLFGWVQSLLNLLGFPPNFLFGVFRQSPARARGFPVKALLALAHGALVPLLAVAAFPLVALERIAGRPGTWFCVLRAQDRPTG